MPQGRRHSRDDVFRPAPLDGIGISRRVPQHVNVWIYGWGPHLLAKLVIRNDLTILKTMVTVVEIKGFWKATPKHHLGAPSYSKPLDFHILMSQWVDFWLWRSRFRAKHPVEQISWKVLRRIGCLNPKFYR